MSSINTRYHGFYVVALLIVLAHRVVRHPRQRSETLNRAQRIPFFLAVSKLLRANAVLGEN